MVVVELSVSFQISGEAPSKSIIVCGIMVAKHEQGFQIGKVKHICKEAKE